MFRVFRKNGSNETDLRRRCSNTPKSRNIIKYPADGVMRLQRSLGNQVVQRLIKSGNIMTKLVIGRQNDPSEGEADQVADRVMQMPEQDVQRQTEVAEEEETLQSKTVSGGISPMAQRQEGEEDEEIQMQTEPEEEEQVQAQVAEEEEVLQPQSVSSVITPLTQRQEVVEDEEVQMQAEPEDEEQIQAQEVEEEEELIQSKERSGSINRGTSNFADRLHSLKSSGNPLPNSLRASFENRFDHDFSGVRTHTGSEASDLARSINAKAFTSGKDIVFGSGQYSTESTQGKQLLAHELTHVVQQTGTNQIRRKVLLGGKYYNPERDYGWIKQSYGNAMVEFLDQMHNKGKQPAYRFRNYAHMHYEIRVRSKAIKGMEKTAGSCCGYPFAHLGGYLNDTYWTKKGPYHFIIKTPLPSGKNPSDAIESIFMMGAGTELECNSMMVAVQYYAILKSIGKKRFNKRFPGGKGIEIRPIILKKGQDPGSALKKQKLYKQVKITGFDDLLPGDWVYFMNVKDYAIHHKFGFWRGLHAVYLGGDKFSGLGKYDLTNDEILFKLLTEYNRNLRPGLKKTIKDVPGIVPQIIRRPVVESYTP